jgi:AcrR family transcriptional regulator
MNLDKVTIVKAAAQQVNIEGWDQLSMGKLAASLGVKTPSLYNHIDGLPGLARELHILSTRELGECMASAAVGYSGAQAVRRVAQAYREYIKSNLGVYMNGVRSAAFQNPQDEELDIYQNNIIKVGLAILSAYELDKKEALHALRGLRSLIHGFATLEAAEGFGIPVDCDESFQWMVEIFINALSQSNQAGSF